MARDLPLALASAVVARVVRVALLAEFAFASETLRMWTGQADTNWAGHTWTGAGDLGGITPVDETTEIGAAGLTFTLSGIPSNLVTLALQDHYRGRQCKLWLACLTEAGAVEAAVRIFGGRMDVMSIEDAGETSTISIQAESRLVDLMRARDARYTDATQKRLFAGDLGCEYVAALAEKPLPWGIKALAAPAASNPQYAAAALAASRTVMRLGT